MIETWNVTLPFFTGNTPRKAYVYIPDSFQENEDLRYPVLYMFDGHNVFFDQDATYGKSWGMGEYLDRTGTQIIVAAVECDQTSANGRLIEYSPYTFFDRSFGDIHGRGDETMEWYVNVFKRYIDENYPTIPDREHTFIAGSSMGGLMSLYAVLQYNHIFSRAAALSPSIWVCPEKLDDLIELAKVSRDTFVYMDYGSNELGFHKIMSRRFAQVTSRLLGRNVMVNSRIIPNGDHCEASWERQIPFFMEMLLYELH